MSTRAQSPHELALAAGYGTWVAVEPSFTDVVVVKREGGTAILLPIGLEDDKEPGVPVAVMEVTVTCKL